MSEEFGGFALSFDRGAWLVTLRYTKPRMEYTGKGRLWEWRFAKELDGPALDQELWKRQLRGADSELLRAARAALNDARRLTTPAPAPARPVNRGATGNNPAPKLHNS